MANKKDLVIVVLATFCLTATILTVIPTRSQNNKYDPWLDTNDDGRINILDISAVAKAWETSGDPTKNVFVTNWGWSWDFLKSTFDNSQYFPFNISWSNGKATYGYRTGNLWCGGYSRMFVHIVVSEIHCVGFGNTTIFLSGIAWNISGLVVAWEQFSPDMCNVTVPESFIWDGYTKDVSNVAEVDTKASSCVLTFDLQSQTTSGWLVGYIAGYVRND